MTNMPLREIGISPEGGRAFWNSQLNQCLFVRIANLHVIIGRRAECHAQLSCIHTRPYKSPI